MDAINEEEKEEEDEDCQIKVTKNIRQHHQTAEVIEENIEINEVVFKQNYGAFTTSRII